MGHVSKALGKEPTEMLDARCTVCNEGFIPADEADTIHLAKLDGSECGGQGVILGEWIYRPTMQGTELDGPACHALGIDIHNTDTPVTVLSLTNAELLTLVFMAEQDEAYGDVDTVAAPGTAKYAQAANDELTRRFGEEGVENLSIHVTGYRASLEDMITFLIEGGDVAAATLEGIMREGVKFD